jgi:tetratricopeptide (TPR) repeat protein
MNGKVSATHPFTDRVSFRMIGIIMPTKTLHFLDITIRIVITVFFSIFPLFFLPVFNEYYDTAKWIFLIVCALLLIILYGIRIVVSGTIVVPQSKNSIGFIALGVASLIGCIVISVNRVEALVSPFGVVSFFGFAVILSVALMYRDAFIKQWVRWAILGSASVVGVLAIYQTLGMGKLLVGRLPFLSDQYWTPVGSITAAGVMLLIVLPLAVWNIRDALKEKHDVAVILSIIATILSVSGFGVIVYRVAPKFLDSVLPMSIAWNILLEVYKNPKVAFAGVGAEGFGNAFTVGKSILFNQSPLWNMRFTLSASALLHLATTLGVLGILGMLVFMKLLLFPFSIRKNPEWTISAILAVLALILTPPNFVVFAVIAVLYLLKPHEPEELRVTPVPQGFKWVGITIAVLCFLISATGLYFAGRYMMAEVTFAKSLRFAQANDGKNTYENQVKAIQLNPYMTSYHLAFAQVNIALAQSIATTARTNAANKTGQIQLTETDQTTMSQLIQQGIEQAKIAIALSPDNSVTWEVLGRIYGNITGMVKDADTWAIAAYEKQVQLDPTTPQARFNLAGAYMVKQDYLNARDQLLIAVQLKPDIANIHYNLAFAFRNLKDYANEKQALETTLKYIEKDSADYKKVESEIQAVSALLAPPVEKTPAQTSPVTQTPNQPPLSTPPAEPKTQVTPKIEITP